MRIAPDNYAAKLFAAAEEILNTDLKTVVLVRRHTGYEFFVKLLRHLETSRGLNIGIATLEDKAVFNCFDTNLRGERFRVLVGETGEAGEGSSFFCVRTLYLLDVPLTATDFEQCKARVDRANSHRGLPEEERTVQVKIVCASLPSPIKNYLGSFFWLSGFAAPIGSEKPAVWERYLRKVEKGVDILETKFRLKRNDPDCLEELQDRLQDDQWEDEAEAVDEEFKKLKLPQQVLQRLRRSGAVATNSVCTETVDETVCKDLAKRCKAVEAAHRQLKHLAMDRSFFSSE